jgi:hypothetical protein
MLVARRPYCFELKIELVASAATAAASTAVVAAASTAAASAGTALLRLEAIAAEDWPIASGFKGNRGLLAAAGADNGRSRGGSRGVTASASAITASTTAGVAPATSGLVGFLGLSARLAALRRRISPFLEERLVSSSKSKFPSAVATGQLQISSHCVPLFQFVKTRRLRGYR